MKTAEQRLFAQYQISKILAESVNLTDAISKILQVITAGLEWALGNYWAYKEEELKILTFWTSPGFKAEAFILASQEIKFHSGKDLPEHVWASKSLLWISEIAKDNNFPRKKSAIASGIHTALCFPLAFNNKIYGVMEFFSLEVLEPDNQLLEFLVAVGAQIGQFMERMKFEEAFRNSEKRKSAILNSTLDCIISMDENGIITEFNPAAERTFGYSKEYALGKPLAGLIIPSAYQERHKQGLARYLKTKQSPIIGKRLELSAMKANGEEFPVELTIIDLQIDKSPIFTGFIRDISLQKELERSKTIFFGNASYKFKTPLHLILGPAADALLDSEQPLASRQFERMQLIQRSARRLLKLSDTLLDFFKLEAGYLQCSYEALDLAKLTNDIAEQFREPIKKAELLFTTKIASMEEKVYVDSNMWQKIVLNLLSNALKYTLVGNITITLKKEDDYAVLQVIDTGVGIPEKELNYVFQRFHRINNIVGRSKEGLGVGLALTSALVKLHSGLVNVKSQIGDGTSFIVKIPLGRAHLSDKQIKTLKRSSSEIKVDLIGITFVEEALSWLSQDDRNNYLSPSSNSLGMYSIASFSQKPNILFAEDNADMRQYIQETLSADYNIRLALTDETALQTALKDKFDLIFINVSLLKADELQFIQSLKSNPKTINIPIVIISENPNDEVCIKALEQGADDQLSKPFSTKELLIRIKTHLELWRSKEELHKTVKEKTLELQQEMVKHSQTEAALVKSEKSYQVLASISPVGIFHAHKTGKIFYINQKALNIMELGPSEGALNLATSIHPEDQENVLARWNKAIQLEGHFKSEYRYLRKDGSEVWVVCEAVPEKEDVNSQLLGYVGTITDVTELKALEKSRLEAIKATEEQQRRRAEEAEAYRKRQEEFIDTMCHELRNPLNGIYGSVSLLQANIEMLETFLSSSEVSSLDLKLREQISSHLKQEKESLEAIDKCARHQKIITDDVLSLSKLEAGKLELVLEALDPKKIIEDVCAMLDHEFNRKNLQISLQFPHKCLEVIGDPNRIAQVLLNLLTNAIKFTPENGEISISLSQLKETSNTRILQFSVKDSGIGLTDDEKAKLFNRFSQASARTSNEYGGSGLGLAISKNLVELMKGEIKVESEKFKGSNFTFTIQCPPVIKQMEKKVVQNLSPTAKTMSKINIQVLIVEDNIINQKVLARILENEGILYYVANNGLEAVEMFNTIPKIDVILMDIEMPIMNGLEATKAIRAREKERKSSFGPVLIIGLSGNARQEHINEALTVGMNDYLVKPYEKVKLLERITFQMENSLSTKQQPMTIVSPPLNSNPLLFSYDSLINLTPQHSVAATVAASQPIDYNQPLQPSLNDGSPGISGGKFCP